MAGPRRHPPEAPSLFQYWNTETIPEDVAALIATFQERNPDFRHRVFSEAEAERFIESHFGARERDAFRACAVPAMQADYFRYCAVLAYGGIYADADYRCVRPLRPLLDDCEGGIVFLRPDMHRVNGREAMRVLNGFFAFGEPNHPFLRLTLDIATANMEARLAERIWAVGEEVPTGIWLTVGPGIFSLIRFLYNWGSFDVFMESAIGTPLEPFGRLFCEVTGDYNRVVEACEGVRFSSFESMFSWIDHPDQAPAYKEGKDPSWHHVKTGLFR
jgi:hypothetical protein